MKVEATCTNDACPTRDAISGALQVQLVENVSFRILGDSPNEVTSAYTDEEGDPLYCQWCNSPLTVQRVARDEAQFAIGEVEATENAKRVLSYSKTRAGLVASDDPLAWMVTGATYVARHASGDHGSAPGFIDELNASAGPDPKGQNIGRLVSQFDHLGSRLWLITERDRHKTTIMLPEEYF